MDSGHQGWASQMPGNSHEAWASIRIHPVETSALVLPWPQYLLPAKALLSKILVCAHNTEIKELVQTEAREENEINYKVNDLSPISKSKAENDPT